MEKRSPLQQGDRRSESPGDQPGQNEAGVEESGSSGSGNASSGEAAQPVAAPGGPETLTDDAIDEINWREVKKVMNRLNSRRSRDRQSCAMRQLLADQCRLRHENENLRTQNKQIREILRNASDVNPRLRTNTHGSVNAQQTTHLPHTGMRMHNQSPVSNNTIQQLAGYSLSYPHTNQGQQNQQNNRAVPPTQMNNLQQHQLQFGSQPFSFNQHQQAATPGGFIANPSSADTSSSTGGSQPESSNSQQSQQVPSLNFQQSQQQAGLNSIPGMIAGLVSLQPGLLFQNNDVANFLATFLSASMQQASVHQQQLVQEGGNNFMGFAGIPNNNSDNDININVLLQAATLLQQQNQNTVSQNSSSRGSSSSTGAAPTPNNGGGQGAG